MHPQQKESSNLGMVTSHGVMPNANAWSWHGNLIEDFLQLGNDCRVFFCKDPAMQVCIMGLGTLQGL